MPYRTSRLLLLMVLSTSVAARAQTYSAGTDLFFYGDNTEFANPFREGETLMGISGRIFVEATLNDAVKI
nr:hypothetical protein [Acidobacteriota bacterium]